MNPVPEHLQRIEAEFRRAWENEVPPDIARFLENHQELSHPDVFRVLIPLDVRFRRQTGREVTSSFYASLGESAEVIAKESLKVDTLKEGHDKYATLPGFNSQAPQTNWQPNQTPGDERLIQGRYRLIKKVGQGGMGSVWLAQQEQPVRRRVAIKVINETVGSEEAISRFQAERQALALMNHPNIAKVLDAGTREEDGRPYFVMEYVQGVPITQYCTEQRLTIRQRLELMITVCEAVQHAHQKGIIHRDIKPSNILVSLQADKPVPKIIDFGLAKALESGARLADQTIVTEIGRVVGTIQYMSPEQAGSNQLDIDTRTDVYSLGVLLYQLLTDLIPLSDTAIANKYLLQIVEIICESEIKRPSQALVQDVEALTKAGKRRQTEPHLLIRQLKGELDWIVLKALERDRINRYQTANGLAMDIQRHLNDEPIAARPPSNTYLLRKLIKKYQGWAIAAGTAGLLLLFGFIYATHTAVQLDRARNEAEAATIEVQAARDQADYQLNVFQSSFGSTNPLEGADPNMSAKDVLVTAQKLLHDDKKLSAASRADLLASIGRAYRGLGDYQRSIDALTESMELLQGLSDSEPKENLYNVYRELAKSKMENGKQLLPTVPNPDQFESSLELMEKAFEGFGLLHDEQSTRLLLVKSDLGVAYMFAFKELAKIGVAKKNYADQAVRILEETYQSFRKVAGPASEDALATYTNLANAFLKQGDAESAVTANLEVIERWEALLKQKQSETATRNDSETAGRDISEIKRIRFRLSIARNNLGEAYHRQGKFAMAITAYREAMAEWYELLSTSHSNLMDTVRLLLECLLEDNQNQAAREFFNEVFKKTQLENRDSARKQAEKDLALIRERLMKKYGIDDSWQVATTVEHPDKND